MVRAADTGSAAARLGGGGGTLLERRKSLGCGSGVRSNAGSGSFSAKLGAGTLGVEPGKSRTTFVTLSCVGPEPSLGGAGGELGAIVLVMATNTF
jgi:hypothetical protein